MNALKTLSFIYKLAGWIVIGISVMVFLTFLVATPGPGTSGLVSAGTVRWLVLGTGAIAGMSLIAGGELIGIAISLNEHAHQVAVNSYYSLDELKEIKALTRRTAEAVEILASTVKGRNNS